jgi:hypothetical protein
LNPRQQTKDEFFHKFFSERKFISLSHSSKNMKFFAGIARFYISDGADSSA